MATCLGKEGWQNFRLYSRPRKCFRLEDFRHSKSIVDHVCNVNLSICPGDKTNSQVKAHWLKEMCPYFAWTQTCTTAEVIDLLDLAGRATNASYHLFHMAVRHKAFLNPWQLFLRMQHVCYARVEGSRGGWFEKITLTNGEKVVRSFHAVPVRSHRVSWSECWALSAHWGVVLGHILRFAWWSCAQHLTLDSTEIGRQWWKLVLQVNCVSWSLTMELNGGSPSSQVALLLFTVQVKPLSLGASSACRKQHLDLMKALGFESLDDTNEESCTVWKHPSALPAASTTLYKSWLHACPIR